MKRHCPVSPPSAYVERLAREKALAGLAALSDPADAVVLGADTAVVLDGRILGKPADRAECLATLAALSGREHQVLTAVALASAQRIESRVVASRVRFRPLRAGEAEAYWATGEPCDKAGSYGIQGLAAVFVSQLEGSYSAVVGLPLCETAAAAGGVRDPVLAGLTCRPTTVRVAAAPGQQSDARVGRMSEEILINITPMESRVAVVENGVLQEVHVERTQKRGIVGNIYKGKVVRVLPGMQAAFVDIGLERAAFIHAAEISTREGSAVESIGALVHEGQSLVVQVTKDPIGTKGARLTTHLSIPSRYLVYMPRTAHVGISPEDRGRGRARASQAGGGRLRGRRRHRGGRRFHPAHRRRGRRRRRDPRSISATCAACGSRSLRR